MTREIKAGEGFAAVTYNGDLLVHTVSPTKRAAMVNWLVAVDHTPIYQTDTDAEIERVFAERAIFRGMASIERVSIALASDQCGGGA